MRIIPSRIASTLVTAQFFTQAYRYSHRNYPQRLIQTMCQGHENVVSKEQPDGSSASSGQPSQSDQKKKQKFKNKQQKQQIAKENPPPAIPLPPNHEIVKQRSSALANGTRYVDTHCHTPMTVQMYQTKAKGTDPVVADIPEFIRELFPPECAAIVDVYCDPPFDGWKEMANKEDLPLDYYFAMGCHPHNAKKYNDAVEGIILEAMKHPKCVAWGEIGLDYHYNLSPQDVQQKVLIRQLELALSLNKNIVSITLSEGVPNVVHTREADDDILRLLKAHVPRETHLHIHCFTDTPQLAAALLDHFPNLFIGITGVITYATNTNTSDVVRAIPLERLLLETDSPFMTPNTVQKTIKSMGAKSTRLNVCWSGMIPWIAEWVANIKNETVEKVLDVTRENAERMYGITV